MEGGVRLQTELPQVKLVTDSGLTRKIYIPTVNESQFKRKELALHEEL